MAVGALKWILVATGAALLAGCSSLQSCLLDRRLGLTVFSARCTSL